jgi:hypothetical protein
MSPVIRKTSSRSSGLAKMAESATDLGVAINRTSLTRCNSDGYGSRGQRQAIRVRDLTDSTQTRPRPYTSSDPLP